MMDTLVLSVSYEPLYTVPWTRAMTLWVGDRVEIIESYVDKFIGTVAGALKMPAVVRFVANTARKRWRTKVKFSRSNVYLRDEGQCQYCSKGLAYHQVHFDHVVPKSRGGRTTWKNYVVSCFACNQKKRNRTPREAGMPLLREPRKPRTLPCSTSPVKRSDAMPEAWKDYI